MPLEIERKFEVVNPKWETMVSGSYLIIQDYMILSDGRELRVRKQLDRYSGFDSSIYTMTVKFDTTNSLIRNEFEVEISRDVYSEMLIHSLKSVTKIRSVLKPNSKGQIWVIDEYNDYTLAEIELSRDDEDLQLPDFVGTEVTGDPKYKNSNL